MRTIFKWLAMIVLVVAGLIFMGTFVPRPFLSVPEAQSSVEAPVRILLLSGPIHTDIALPLDENLFSALPFLADSGIPVNHPNARWLIVGWGGRAFYLQTPTWSELKPIPVLKAFTVDRSVMHVDIAGAIDEAQEAVTAFDIESGNYAQLLSFVAASFRPVDGQIAPIAGAGYGETDRFFEANGWFNAAVGCNTWTAAALREAGLQTGWWNPLPSLLSLSLHLYNEPLIAGQDL